VAEIKEVMKRSTEQGMQTFDQALFNLYKEGGITYEDAILHADSENEVRLMIKLAEKGGVEKYDSRLSGMSLQEEEH